MDMSTALHFFNTLAYATQDIVEMYMLYVLSYCDFIYVLQSCHVRHAIIKEYHGFPLDGPPYW